MPFIRATTTVENIQNTITSNDAPQFPTIGQMWLDTSVTPPVVRQWNGTEWVVVHLDIKQLDPVSMDEINKIIQDTINEVNSSRNELDEALKQAQDAVDKANIASGNVEKVTADVNEAKKNAQDAIDKANLNDASITEIKKQQSEDGQKIADISQNYNGIQQSVTDLAKKQESDRTQLAGMIQDKVSNEDFEASNTILADRIDEVISSSDGRFNAIQSTIDSTTQTIKGIDGRVTQNTTSINGINTTVQNKVDKTEVTQLAGQISETVENQEATNQRVATAEQNISALTTADGNQNKRLDTAEKSIQTISTKTDNNTELINETKKTADSNSAKIVDTSGRVSTVEQTLTEQKQTIADNTGKINQAIQDIDSAERTISDVAGRVSKVEQKADGISSTVSKVQTDLNTTNTKLNSKADTSYVNTQLGTKANQSDLNATNNKVNSKANQSDLNNTNNRLNGVDSNLNGLLNTGTNCWINSNFADGVNHWKKSVPQIQGLLNEDYLGTKVLDIKMTENKSWVFIGTEERYPVTPGEKLSFSWYQNLITGDSGTVFGEVQCYADKTSGRNGTVKVRPSDSSKNKWLPAKLEGWVVPSNVNYIGIHFCINGIGEVKVTQPQFVHGTKVPNYQPSPNDLNNIQSDVDLNKSQIQSQQTQINQKPDRTEIIASSNGNPKAYFQLGTFSSGPNAGRGYVSVGADYGFFLKTNTFIEDGFKLSANHIDAGVICGKKPTWMNDSTTPDDFKNQSKYYPELRLATQDGDDPLSLTLYSNTTGTSGKSKTANRIQLNNEGLKFEMFNWTDAKLLNTTKPSLVKPFQDNQDPNSTGISVESGNGTGLLVQNGPAYRNVGKKVVIGYDMKSTELCAVGSSVIYTNRINSLNDSDGPEDPGITVDDVLYIDEPIASKWTQNGKRTSISYPNKNGGDSIEFHTAEGDGAFSNYKAYFAMVNGNWKTGNVDAQHHAIVVGGNGYILTFSNEDTTTDNAQGNGSAQLVAAKYITNSSRELKEDIKPINNIDQAVKDILKIEPKQYLYQSQVDQLSEWEDNGKPADTFKHLDTEINVGLIAEEMDEYDSLRPFIEKVTDEEGNEGILGIDYSKLTPLLLAVCQKQDNKINELEERLVRMELLMKDLHS